MLYSILPCALLLLPFYMYMYLKHTFLVSESSQPAGVILYKHPGQPLLHISTLQMWPTQYQSVFHWHSGSADLLEWYGILFCTLAKFLNWCFQMRSINEVEDMILVPILIEIFIFVFQGPCFVIYLVIKLTFYTLC